MKKISKRVLAVILTIAMILPMGTSGVVSNAENSELKLRIHITDGCDNIKSFSVSLTLISPIQISLYKVENCSLDAQTIEIPISEDLIHLFDWYFENSADIIDCVSSEATIGGFMRSFEYYLSIEYNGLIYFGSYHRLYAEALDVSGQFDERLELQYDYYRGKIPGSYNFVTDSYNFKNFSSMIPYGYFKTMYGNAKGYELWKNQWWQDGLCFGMTYTTAAFYNGLPSCSSIRDLSKSSVISIGNNSLSVATYIKYAHIYQYSEEFQGHSVWSDAKTIYNLVKQAAMDNLLTVTIGMLHETDGGHRVLAIGIEGNDILIDDPNYTNQIQRIKVNDDGSWSFSGLDGWNSNTCAIRYSLDITEPYKFLRSLKTLTVNEAFIDDSTIDSFSSSYEADTLSKNYLLLSVDSDAYNIENTDVSRIETEYNDGTDAAEQSDLYWVAEDKTVTVTGVSENSEIELAGNDTIIGVTTSDSSSVKLTVDEESDIITATLDTTTSNEYSLRLRSFDEDSNVVTATITGTADGDTVTAFETSDGIQVTGLNDITVTLETADGSAETSAKVTDGETVNITVDDPNNTVTTDWQCKHPDDNHDGVCDNCGEDFTKDCDCICHSESKLVQFIYKIVRFLWKLFGIEDRHFCACGKAHW